MEHKHKIKQGGNYLQNIFLSIVSLAKANIIHWFITMCCMMQGERKWHQMYKIK